MILNENFQIILYDINAHSYYKNLRILIYISFFTYGGKEDKN